MSVVNFLIRIFVFYFHKDNIMNYLKKYGLLITFLLFTSVMFAQNDIVLKIDGTEMIGKVIKMNDNNLQFVYQNETVEYTVKKSDIVKITFSSGRIEFYNQSNSSATKNVSLEGHHNKAAILPFGFIKDQSTSNHTMTKKIQQETYSVFKKKTNAIKFQDPSKTNDLLAKAGVVNNNIEGYTMGEICNILGVEYFVQGLVTVERSSVTNVNSSTSTSKKKSNAYVDKNGKIVGDIWNDGKKTSNTFAVSTSTQNYSTSIYMNIYNDKGDNIFSQDHSSFRQTEDAYKITLSYLAKRTPIYKR